MGLQSRTWLSNWTELSWTYVGIWRQMADSWGGAGIEVWPATWDVSQVTSGLGPQISGDTGPKSQGLPCLESFRPAGPSQATSLSHTLQQRLPATEPQQAGLCALPLRGLNPAQRQQPTFLPAADNSGGAWGTMCSRKLGDRLQVDSFRSWSHHPIHASPHTWKSTKSPMMTSAPCD